MIEMIDLEKIGKDRMYLLTLSRKINEIVDFINNNSKYFKEVSDFIDQIKDNTGGTVTENKISDVENTDLTINQQEEKNNANSSTILWEEISNNIDNVKKCSISSNGKWPINKKGNRLIRRSFKSLDKAQWK